MHPPPRHLMSQTLSGVMGSVSIAFWIIVFTPQIYECWRRKSSDGLSLAFVALWLAGDFFNVAGAVLQHVLPTMTLLAVYYTFADLVLLGQCLVYTDKPVESEPLLGGNSASGAAGAKPTLRKQAAKYVLYILCVILFGVGGFLLSPHTAPEQPPSEQPLSFWGQVNGWLCAVLYLVSRVPQIKLNWERKSTDGISLLFFIFAVLGNVTYVVSILASGVTKHSLILNASWLAGSLGTLFLDFVIFAQFILYQ